jgi:hypothetical protein
MRSLIRGSRVLSAMAITFHLGGSLSARTGQVRKRTTTDIGIRCPVTGRNVSRFHESAGRWGEGPLATRE